MEQTMKMRALILTEDNECLVFPLVIKPKKCCVCGEDAYLSHQSIVEGVDFMVCEKHYCESSSCLGYDKDMKINRMGLIDKEGNWIDIKY